MPPYDGLPHPSLARNDLPDGLGSSSYGLGGCLWVGARGKMTGTSVPSRRSSRCDVDVPTAASPPLPAGMPYHNDFRHQPYRRAEPAAEFELLTPATPPELHSDEFQRRLAEAGVALARAGVGTIYLVHGTLAGTDVSGFVGELGRIVPHWAASLRRQGKRLVDNLAGDYGNYDDGFLETLRSGINARLENPIAVHRYLWSSENHHLGRADAAVRLLAELLARDFPPGQGVQLWGHSHAGNAFALLTNLLGGDVDSRRSFFKATRWFYRVPGRGTVDFPVWDEMRRLLRQDRNPLEHVRLDFVTFGTPVRYGWETSGYRRLLHFMNHRRTPGLPEYQVPFPPKLDQIHAATAGDFFQQFFIAGTNFPPNLVAWRSWVAEQRLGHLLQSGLRRRDLWERLKAGLRVPAEGRTLLVDYAAGDPESARLLAGHAVYTKQRWLPFHLDTILSRLDATECHAPTDSNRDHHVAP